MDGWARATGAVRYVDDLQPAGCLHGATVRSPVAHGRIRRIRRDPAFDWSDVVVVTARDIPGENRVVLMTRDQPALAEEVVRHVMEPIALVAAPTRARARAAARAIQVDIEPLPALLDPERAAGSDIVLFPPDNVFKAITVEKGDVDAVREGRLIEGVYRTGLHEQLYIEPQGMLARPRPDGGLTITGSLQCPFYVVEGIRDLLGPAFRDPGRLNVVQAATGGGFGGKEEYPSMVAAHAALLALAAGRPVKLVYDRSEDLRATTKRHPSRIRIRTRVDGAGRLLAFEADVLLDGGAYNTLTPVVLSRAVIHATGPYACPNVRIRGRAVATNTPPNGAFRGFGAPQAHFAAERHMDRIARELALDPVELRRRNLLRPGDRTATGQRLDRPGAEAVLDRVLEFLREAPPPCPSHVPGGGSGVSRVVTGRGVALAFHGCGFTGNGEARIAGEVAIELRDGRPTVLTASTDIGQGAETVFRQIVAEELGLDVERVDVAPHDTARVPDSGPTVASRTAMVVGEVVRRAAVALRRRLQEEVGPAGSFEELVSRHGDRGPVRATARYRDDGRMVWDETTYQGDAYPTYGWNCTAVEVAVDLETGEVRPLRVVTATDVGRALNRTVVEGQIEGGALQGVFWALTEEVHRDEQGCMRNDRLTTYIVPTSLDAPELHTLLVEIPYEGGPFGAKGVGEIPIDAPAAAVAQAVESATGAVIDELPLSPERVLEALP